MTGKERKQFSQVICSSTLPSLTPFLLLQYYCMKTKVTVSLVDYNITLQQGLMKEISVGNPHIKLFVCPAKMSGKKLLTNESGLLVDVNSADKNFLLTGDCTYKQANEAIRLAYAQIQQDKAHYLVVPHHGGKRDADYSLPQYCKMEAAVISVDQFRYKNGQYVQNGYGHPKDDVIIHFVKHHKCRLYRTDYENQDMIME